MAVESVELQNRPPLTVEEFYALARREGWDEDTRVELLDGEIVWLNPINEPHAGCVNRLNRLFHRRLPEGAALVAIQNPVRVDVHDEPQPDVVLLRPRGDDYGTATPGPGDVLLLVEVADTNLRSDLGRKARIYADAGIVEYWVVDLRNEAVYVHREPGSGGYRSREVRRRGQALAPRLAPAVTLVVDEVLG